MFEYSTYLFRYILDCFGSGGCFTDFDYHGMDKILVCVNNLARLTSVGLSARLATREEPLINQY